MIRYDELSQQEQLLVQDLENSYVRRSSVKRGEFIKALSFTLNKYKRMSK